MIIIIIIIITVFYVSSVFSVEAPTGDTTEDQLKSNQRFVFEERGEAEHLEQNLL